MKNDICRMLVLGSILLTTPLWAYQTDDQIESSIKNSYIFNDHLKDDNITIHSRDGIVTLTGIVADENHKFLAQNTAENLPEVKSVDNQLQVRETPPAYSDAWIGIKVKAALLFHQNVSPVRTKVDVKEGVVTLSGEADNEAQKDLTAEYAKDIDGVKKVINDMVIKSVENRGPSQSSSMDDASITAQVKLTLLLHRSTSSMRTHVKTVDGVVTLTGKAKNESEKSLVTKLVSDISGVKRIINNMDVSP